MFNIKSKVTPKKLYRKSASRQDLKKLSEKVTLERVFGLTATNTNGVASNLINGLIAYPAGCVIVLYNTKTNKQSHIINHEKKTITCLNFSGDGKYLVSGECGQQPMVRVWELGETVTQVSELKGHKSGIISVEFSPNQKLLVSIGDQHDMLVNIWNWKIGHTVACNKSGCRVRSVSFSENGQYLVTVGNRHVKFWYLDTEAASRSNVPIAPITGRSGILGDQRNNCFTDVKCGRGRNFRFTYCVTKSGLLCLFSENRILDKWVQLKAGSSHCLVVTEKYIFCGCSDGVVRVFNPTDLRFISTLPLPHKLGVNVCSNQKSPLADEKKKYADVVALAVDEYTWMLSCVYNDHSLYIWDVHNVKSAEKHNSFLFHSACIWGLEMYTCCSDKACLPNGSLLTCSSDDTIRIWNIEEKATSNIVYFRNNYSQELLKIVYVDEGLSNLQDTSVMHSNTNKGDGGRSGVRCMQVSPDGQYCAAGDRAGNLRIYKLDFFDEIFRIEVHESEILCVEFSDPESGFELLATSSRDRLVHIFDARKDFALVQTIDDHSSSITAVRFNYDLGVLQLLSCGADKVVMFHTGQINGSGGIHFVRNTIVPGKATLFDMDIEPNRKRAATVGQDRNLRIYDIQGAKQVQSYKGSPTEGNLIKFKIDPSGVYVAISCSDKSISIYDFANGECETVITGHSELVTGLQFTSDGKRLVSVSGDGCMFVWTLPSVFTENIQSRLDNLDLPLPNTIDDSISRRETFIVSSPGNSTPAEHKLDRTVGYRFSVGQLPGWAQKQIAGGDGSEQSKGTNASLGKWGERNDGQLSTVEEIENKSIIHSNGSLESMTSSHVTSSYVNEHESELERSFHVTENGANGSKVGTAKERIDSATDSASEMGDTSETEESVHESDDEAFSPLSEHFEKLGTPVANKMLSKQASEKPMGLFQRASLSAKFLSRSQRSSNTNSSRAPSVSNDEQKRRIEMLKAKFSKGSSKQPTRKLSQESPSTKSGSKLQKSRLLSKSCQNISSLQNLSSSSPATESTRHDKNKLSSASFTSPDTRRSSTPLHLKLKVRGTQNVWARSPVSPVISPVKENFGESDVVMRRKGSAERRRNRPKSMLVLPVTKERSPNIKYSSDSEDKIPIDWNDVNKRSSEPVLMAYQRDIDIGESNSQQLSRVAQEIEENVRHMKASYERQPMDMQPTSDKYIDNTPTAQRLNTPPEKDNTIDTFNDSLTLPKTHSTNEVTIEVCQSALRNLIHSYNDVRQIQNKVMEQTDAPQRPQLVALISKTYHALETSMSDQQTRLASLDDTENIQSSGAYKDLQAQMMQEKPDIVALLDKYSSLLVDIATSKIKEKVPISQ